MSSTTRTEIRLPDLGADLVAADLVAWLVSVGDRVEAGDLIAELETDKSTIEFESPVAGVVAELRVAAPATGVKVGEVLAIFETGGASKAPAAKTSAPSAPERTPTPARTPAAAPSPARAPAPAPKAENQPAASARTAAPATALARRIADQRGVDLASIGGTGAGGRITKADVESAAPSPSPSASKPTATAPASSAKHAATPLSRMRRTIAARLGESKREIPHFYLEATCDPSALLATRRRLTEGEGAPRLSVNDFCVAAAARALRDVPDANVAWRGDSIERFSSIDVAVAVALPDGLITPVVRGADALGLVALSERLRELVARAKAGKLEPREYQGGLNISNLGMFGITAVWPIVNPPHACILGIGAVEEVPVVRDGAVVPGARMTATLAADHRAVDGAVGAQLLAAFRRYVEHPLEMML